MITPRYEYDKIPRETVDGTRHYCLPDGSKVASVTSILEATKSQESRDALAAWRRNVGDRRAQEITTAAANRGTRMHSYLEHYIKTDDIKEFPSNPFAQPSWFMSAEIILNGLGQVGEFWGCEVPVYHSGLYAGTTDCIGTWHGEPAIIDFKQSNKVKQRAWIDDYFIQLTAYGQAHDHMHGTNISTGVILMCVQPTMLSDGTWSTPQYLEFVIQGDEYRSWADQWISRVDQYYHRDKYKT